MKSVFEESRLELILFGFDVLTSSSGYDGSDSEEIDPDKDMAVPF